MAKVVELYLSLGGTKRDLKDLQDLRLALPENRSVIQSSKSDNLKRHTKLLISYLERLESQNIEQKLGLLNSCNLTLGEIRKIALEIAILQGIEKI